MNYLFFTVSFMEGDNEYLEIQLSIINEKRERIKKLSLHLRDSQDIEELLNILKEYKIKIAITWNSKMKEQLLKVSEDLNTKEIFDALILKDIILDSIRYDYFNDFNIGLAAKGYDLNELKEDLSSTLSEIYFCFQNKEIFNKDVLNKEGAFKFRNKELDIKNKKKFYIFIDFEFDIENRQKAELISIGSIVSENLVVTTDEFYSLVKPVNKKSLSEECYEITHITQEELDNADNINKVINKFCNWIDKYSGQYVIYNWGNFDKVALSRILRYNGLMQIYNKYFRDMYDIQEDISKSIIINDEIVSKCMGLEKMKEMYSLSGIVKHNALSDAEDLMKVVSSYTKEFFNIYVARKMYKEQIRKTYLWNIEVPEKKVNITYGIVCFIKSLNANIDIDTLKKEYSKVFFQIIKDIPMYLLLTFENNNKIHEIKVKVNLENKEVIKSFIKIDLEEIMQ